MPADSVVPIQVQQVHAHRLGALHLPRKRQDFLPGKLVQPLPANDVHPQR
jgi:hypothetical protein